MKKILFLFVLICTVATACGPVTPMPTATIPFMTPTRFRTATPSPAPLPFNTPFLTPEIAMYDLPQWLRSSNDHVLMLIDPKTDYSTWRKTHRLVTFIDLDTDERFDLDIPSFKYAFWIDKLHIGFLHGDSCSSYKFGSILDLNTGVVKRYKFQDLADTWFCPNSVRRYIAYTYYYEDRTVITIFDNHNGTETNFHVTQSATLNLRALFSPDFSTLVVLQTRSDSFEYGDQFSIYSFPSFELNAVLIDLKIEQGFAFSQDGKKLFYVQEHTPCIVDLITLAKNCGLLLDEIYHPGNLSPVQLNETKVIFGAGITENERQICVEDLKNNNRDCDTVGLESAICVYDFSTGEIICPTRWLFYLRSTSSLELNYQNNIVISTQRYFVRSFLASPDGNFILFTSKNYPYSGRKCGIISVYETKYYELGDDTCTSSGNDNILAEWRPMP